MLSLSAKLLFTAVIFGLTTLPINSFTTDNSATMKLQWKEKCNNYRTAHERRKLHITILFFLIINLYTSSLGIVKHDKWVQIKQSFKMPNTRNFPLFNKLYKLNPFAGIPIFISFYDLLLKVNVYFYGWTYYYKIV